MIDADDFVSINDARGFFPGRPSLSTLWRWSLQGVKGPNGDRVKLRTIKSGGRVFVSREAVDAFLAAMNGDAEPQETETEVTRRSREARAALEKLGV